MSNSRKSNSTNRSTLDRAAIVAAAGISAALGLASTSSAATVPSAATTAMRPMGAHEISPSAVRMTSAGVTLHSARLSAALTKDKAGTIKALQARFPGLTASQVSLGANGMVTLKISQAAFAVGHRPGDDRADNGICNGGACAAPLLPGEEGFRE